jgi:hypothetical protein
VKKLIYIYIFDFLIFDLKDFKNQKRNYLFLFLNVLFAAANIAVSSSASLISLTTSLLVNIGTQ